MGFDALNPWVVVAGTCALALVLALGWLLRRPLRTLYEEHVREPVRAATRSKTHLQVMVDVLVAVMFTSSAVGAFLGLDDVGSFLASLAVSLLALLLVIRLLRVMREVEEAEDKMLRRRIAGAVRSIVGEVVRSNLAASERRQASRRRCSGVTCRCSCQCHDGCSRRLKGRRRRS